MRNLNFTIEAKDSDARAGSMYINGNKISTPTFMPVATRGAIKGLPMNLMKEIDNDFILCNTYHLLLKPGSKLIESLGGIHKYIDWDNFILTDSGGFQAWSLGALQTDEGIHFKSVYDVLLDSYVSVMFCYTSSNYCEFECIYLFCGKKYNL